MQELGFLNKYGRMQGDYKHVIIFQGIVSSCTANNKEAPQMIKQFLPFALGAYVQYQQGLRPWSRSCPQQGHLDQGGCLQWAVSELDYWDVHGT